MRESASFADRLIRWQRQHGRHDLPWQQTLRVPPVTASFGVAVFPDHGRHGTELLEAADAALFRAKSAQRDRIELAGPPEGI